MALLWCWEGAWADAPTLVPSELLLRRLTFDHMDLCRARTFRLYQFVFLSFPPFPSSLIGSYESEAELKFDMFLQYMTMSFCSFWVHLNAKIHGVWRLHWDFHMLSKHSTTELFPVLQCIILCLFNKPQMLSSCEQLWRWAFTLH